MKKSKEAGFSLIEVLISIVIFSILASAIVGVYISTSRAITVQNTAAGAQQSVRTALEIMAQDIRMAGYEPLHPGGDAAKIFGIPITTANKIQVTSDRWIDENYPLDHPNNNIDEAGFERISYELVGNELRRILYEGTNSQSSQSLIDNVTDLQFTYFDSNNNITNNISDIVSVNILLTVEENAGYGNTVSRTLQTRVYCRNLDVN